MNREQEFLSVANNLNRLKEVLKAVAEMRQYQKAAKAGNTFCALEAERIEARVDAMLEDEGIKYP